MTRFHGTTSALLFSFSGRYLIVKGKTATSVTHLEGMAFSFAVDRMEVSGLLSLFSESWSVIQIITNFVSDRPFSRILYFHFNTLKTYGETKLVTQAQ